MSKPCIICVAITGSVPTKKDNPNVPISISEQIESTHESFEAGATICHAHVRNEDETPTSDPEKFALLKEGISKHCQDMIIQFSTGGRSGAGKERGGMLPLKPEAVSELMIKKIQITYKRLNDTKVAIDTSKKYFRSLTGFKSDL